MRSPRATSSSSRSRPSAMRARAASPIRTSAPSRATRATSSMESGIPARSAPSSTNSAMNVGYRTGSYFTLSKVNLTGEFAAALDFRSAASEHFRGSEPLRAGGHRAAAVRGGYPAAALPGEEPGDAGAALGEHHLVRHQRPDGPTLRRDAPRPSRPALLFPVGGGQFGRRARRHTATRNPLQ